MAVGELCVVEYGAAWAGAHLDLLGRFRLRLQKEYGLLLVSPWSCARVSGLPACVWMSVGLSVYLPCLWFDVVGECVCVCVCVCV